MTPSPTATFEPTGTPQPTLPPAEAQALVLDLLSNNAGCRLPCWWGFTPGKTSWQTAESLLARVALKLTTAIGSQDGSSQYVLILSPEHHPTIPFRQYYHVQHGTIEWIEIQVFGLRPYFLADFLSTHGKPGEVWVETQWYVPSLTSPFTLVLFYPEQGMMVLYNDWEGVRQNGKVRECPRLISAYTLALWSPERALAFEEALKHSLEFRLETPYRPLEEATGMNVETFYQTFREADASACLETPMELWP